MSSKHKTNGWAARWNRSVALMVMLLTLAVAAPKADAQVRVTAIATALNHISVIELAPGETVARVAAGATQAQIEVQWTGPFVLVKPLQPGLSTNLVVFSNRGGVYSYEILPAGSPATMTMLVRQYDQTTLTKDAALSAALRNEIESENARNTELLLHTSVINTKAVRGQKTGIAVRVNMVSEDARNYYVRFSLTNHDTHDYRVTPPTIMKITPVSSAGFALAHRDSELSPAEFSTLTGHIEHAVPMEATTLKKVDLLPNSTVEFTLAFAKPKTTPGIFRFAFAQDYGSAVEAVAVF